MKSSLIILALGLTSLIACSNSGNSSHTDPKIAGAQGNLEITTDGADVQKIKIQSDSDGKVTCSVTSGSRGTVKVDTAQGDKFKFVLNGESDTEDSFTVYKNDQEMTGVTIKCGLNVDRRDSQTVIQFDCGKTSLDEIKQRGANAKLKYHFYGSFVCPAS